VASCSVSLPQGQDLEHACVHASLTVTPLACLQISGLVDRLRAYSSTDGLAAARMRQPLGYVPKTAATLAVEALASSVLPASRDHQGAGLAGAADCDRPAQRKLMHAHIGPDPYAAASPSSSICHASPAVCNLRESLNLRPWPCSPSSHPSSPPQRREETSTVTGGANPSSRTAPRSPGASWLQAAARGNSKVVHSQNIPPAAERNREHELCTHASRCATPPLATLACSHQRASSTMAPVRRGLSSSPRQKSRGSSPSALPIGESWRHPSHGKTLLGKSNIASPQKGAASRAHSTGGAFHCSD
jgi:hypothetical protein